MANHHRGLWGYSGNLADGPELTVQSTGMGGPSAAIVLEELAGLGVRKAIRVGSAGALTNSFRLGEMLVVEAALSADGTSAALGAEDTVHPDPALTHALREAAPGTRSGTIVSTDLFYDPDASRAEGWRDRGAVAVEMEAASLFALGARLGMAIACVLVISDIVGPDRRARITDEELEHAAIGAASAAAAAIGARR